MSKAASEQALWDSQKRVAHSPSSVDLPYCFKCSVIPKKASACWYCIDSCKNNTVSPEDGSGSFENAILPLSSLLEYSMARTNDLLLACGLLKKIETGRYKGHIGVSPSGWEHFISKFKLQGVIEVTQVTAISIIGSKVWCIRVGIFGDGETFNAKTQVTWT